MPLSSELFTNPFNRQLEDCMIKNSAHITKEENSLGDHVVKIQIALLRLLPDELGDREKELINQEMRKKEYGQATAAAVLKYKSRPGKEIINKSYQAKPDDKVGIMTITRLDKELRDLEGKGSQPSSIKTQDIMVHILGARVGIPLEGQEEINGQREVGVPSVEEFDRSVNTDDYLVLHKPLKHKQWHGGQGSKSPVNQIVSFIQKEHDPNGFIIIIGLSSGGPVSIDVAQALALGKEKKISLSYLAILDGAFDSGNDRRLKTVFQTFKCENFFQTLGNFAHQEFHGPIISGTNIDFSNDAEFQDERIRAKVRKEKALPFLKNREDQRFIDKVHFMAIKKGYLRARPEATRLLLP